MELTEQEKEFLKMLFKMGYVVLSSVDGYFDVKGEYFTRNDFANLAEKLGMDYDDYCP